jgi:hypothetical protein
MSPRRRRCRAGPAICSSTRSAHPSIAILVPSPIRRRPKEGVIVARETPPFQEALEHLLLVLVDRFG